MFKKEWTAFGILSAFTVALTLFTLFYTRKDGTHVGWLLYVAIVAIVATFALLVFLLYLSITQRFNILLQREHFVAQKQYAWRDQKLLIDFDSNRLANTYISTKPIVQFSEVASFRIETYRSGENAELDEDQCFVSLVIAISKAGFESEYLYIPAYEVKVSAEDGWDVKEITEELAEKYPKLADMLELQQDVKRIIEINAANGIHYNVQKN